MFVHVVYFWLKDELTADQRADFLRGLRTLPAIAAVARVHIGVPVASDRPVVDSSYHYALIVEFADQDAHDVYQVHPIHRQFVADFSSYWTRIQVYDSVEA